MRKLLTGLHELLTGVDPENIDAEAIGVPGIGTLEGCRVICGLDTIQQTVPAGYYPLVVLEPGDEKLQKRNFYMAGPASIAVDIVARVPGRIGALFGKTESGPGLLILADRVLDLVRRNETLGGAAVGLVQADIAHRGLFAPSSPWMGKRIAVLNLVYTIHRGKGA